MCVCVRETDRQTNRDSLSSEREEWQCNNAIDGEQKQKREREELGAKP